MMKNKQNELRAREEVRGKKMDEQKLRIPNPQPDSQGAWALSSSFFDALYRLDL